MRYTFSIDESSDKAIALLEYLRTLEFVKEETPEYVLTDEQQKTLKERRARHLSGESKSFSLNEVMNSLGKD